MFFTKIFLQCSVIIIATLIKERKRVHIMISERGEDSKTVYCDFCNWRELFLCKKFNQLVCMECNCKKCEAEECIHKQKLEAEDEEDDGLVLTSEYIK